MRRAATLAWALGASLALGVTCSSAVVGASVPKRVLVRVHAMADALPELRATLADALTLPAVSFQIESAPTIELSEVLRPHERLDDLLSLIWIDRDPDHDDLFMSDRQQDRVLIRRISAGGRALAVRNEELSQIVRAVIEALLDGGTVGISMKEARARLATAPPKPVEAPPPPEARSFASLGARYEPVLFADGPTLRHRALLALAWQRRGAHAALGLRGLLGYSPFRLPHTSLGATLNALIFRGEISTGWKLGAHALAHLGLGGGIDAMQLVPIAESDQAVVAGPSTQLIPALRLALGTSYEWTRLYARFEVLLEVTPRRESYVARSSLGESTLFSPWQLQPGIGFELGWGDRL